MEQFRCHPLNSASPDRCAHRHADRRVAQKARESEVGDARRVVTVDQNVALRTISLQPNEILKGLTYAFEVCVHGRPLVEVSQSPRNICQLKKRY